MTAMMIVIPVNSFLSLSLSPFLYSFPTVTMASVVDGFFIVVAKAVFVFVVGKIVVVVVDVVVGIFVVVVVVVSAAVVVVVS